ncbi:MAG: hypothetical protein GQ527_10090 [Bacteroidales bacterium]|nr:hypothetical protein [Bacteroidales bacterium]
MLFEAREAWWYIPKNNLGHGKKGSQGASLYVAKNPEFGALITYYLRESVKSKKDLRKEKETKLKKNKQPIEFPNWEDIDEELIEVKTSIWLVINNPKGEQIKKIALQTKKGMHRVNWDLSTESIRPITRKGSDVLNAKGKMVAPGQYFAVMIKEERGHIEVISDTIDIQLKALYKGSLKGAEPEEVALFWKEIEQLQSEMSIFYIDLRKAIDKTEKFQIALNKSKASNAAIFQQLFLLRKEFVELEKEIHGPYAMRALDIEYKPTISQRIQVAAMGTNSSTYGPTPTHLRSLEIAKEELELLKTKLQELQKTILAIESSLQDIGAPIVIE